MFFTKKILSLLLLSSVQSMEVCYDRGMLRSNRNIEKIVISQQTTNNLNHDQHTMHLEELPSNLQVYFAQQAGRASQINFNAKYENTRALLERDYQVSFIESHVITDGYRFHVNNPAGRYLVPVSGSYRIKNGEEFETRYFVSGYFFDTDYTVRGYISLPNNRGLIDRYLRSRIENREPLEVIPYDPVERFFDITASLGEIIHVNLFNIANIEVFEIGQLSVTNFAASTVFFNKCALQNGNMIRKEGNRGDGNASNTIASAHHYTNQLLIDPSRSIGIEPPILIAPPGPIGVEPPLPNKREQESRGWFGEGIMKKKRVVEKESRDETKALFLLGRIKKNIDTSQDLEALKTLIKNSAQNLSPATIVKCYANILRHQYDLSAENEMLTLLSEFEEKLCYEEFVESYVFLVKAKIHNTPMYANNLRTFLMEHQNEISHETKVETWRSIVCAKLPTTHQTDAKALRELLLNQGNNILPEIAVRARTAVVCAKLPTTQQTDAEALRELLLNQGNNILPEIAGRAWVAVARAKLPTQEEDVERLRSFLINEEMVPIKIKAMGWQAVLESRFRIGYETFEKIKRLIRFAEEPSRFAKAIGFNTMVENSHQCQELIRFCKKHKAEESVIFFQGMQPSFGYETIELSISPEKERRRFDSLRSRSREDKKEPQSAYDREGREERSRQDQKPSRHGYGRGNRAEKSDSDSSQFRSRNKKKKEFHYTEHTKNQTTYQTQTNQTTEIEEGEITE